MKLTISAILTDEQISSVAKAKGWSETEWVGEGDDMSQKIEVKNTKLPSLIVDFYHNMIIDDVSKIFIEERTKLLKDQILQVEELVREDVSTAITSSIE